MSGVLQVNNMSKAHSTIICLIKVLVIAIVWSIVTLKLGWGRADDDYYSQSETTTSGVEIYTHPTELRHDPIWEEIGYYIASFPMGYLQGWDKPQLSTGVSVHKFWLGLIINSLLWSLLLVFLYNRVAISFRRRQTKHPTK